jgi:hypothetical protein
LKNTDPVGSGVRGPAEAVSAAITSTEPEAPSLATGDIGSASDEQLNQAIDVLRGLALVSGRSTQ